MNNPVEFRGWNAKEFRFIRYFIKRVIENKLFFWVNTHTDFEIIIIV